MDSRRRQIRAVSLSLAAGLHKVFFDIAITPTGKHSMRMKLALKVLKSTFRGRDTFETTSFAVEIPEADPSEISRPYWISKKSSEEAHPRRFPLVVFDISDTIEYRRRCWMPLVYDQPDNVANQSLTELLANYVTGHIETSDFNDGSKLSNRAITVAAARLTSDLLIHDGKVFVPDIVPVYAVARSLNSDAASVEVVPYRASFALDRRHLYREDEKDKVVERYRLIGGRKRIPELRKLTKTRFDVDIHGRRLRDEVFAMFRHMNYQDTPPGFFQNRWPERVMGGDVLKTTQLLAAVTADPAAATEEILEMAEPYARMVREKIVPDSADPLFDTVDAILDIGQRFRATALRHTKQEPGEASGLRR